MIIFFQKYILKTVSVYDPLNYSFYWKNHSYLYNKRGEPEQSDIIEKVIS